MERQEAADLVNGLFDTWGNAVVRYAFQLTHSMEQAEDLAQEAFMALYEDLRKGKAIDNVKAWTLTVVRNQAYKAFRDRSRHREVLEANEVLDTRPSPEPPAERWDEVRHLFNALTPREAEVMALRLEDLKYCDIAHQLHISDKSVATLLARGLSKMKAAQEANAQRVALLPGMAGRCE
jgi:RNA polymerase sigma-70 factor (ECF subfamily)